MKLRLTTSALLLTLTSAISSATFAEQNNPPEDDPFAELDQAMEAFEYEGSEAELQEFEQWKADYLAEYQQFRQEHFQKLDDVRDNLISLWGDAEVSSQEEYVDYSEDKKVKTVLDFEKNEIRVSVLHDSDEGVDQQAVVAALTEQSQRDEALAQLVGESVDEKLATKLITSANKVEVAPSPVDNQKAVVEKEIKIIEQQSAAQEQQIEKVYDLLNAQEESSAR